MVTRKGTLQAFLSDPIKTLRWKFISLLNMSQEGNYVDVNQCLQKLQWLTDIDPVSFVLEHLQDSLASLRSVRRFLDVQLPNIKQHEYQALLRMTGVPNTTAIQQSTQFSSAVTIFMDGLTKPVDDKRPSVERIIIELTLISWWEGQNV